MNLDLKVRDLQKGEQGTLTFESTEAARTWLKDRPKFTEVLGVASAHVTKEESQALKACMRALDEEEGQLIQQLEEAATEELLQREEAKRQEALAEAERHRAEMAAADPNRPMEVCYCFDDEMSLVDGADLREITPEARQAVLDWVTERNTWVESRGQVVGIAKVQVYPGPLPEGEDERVVQGNFAPVMAPTEG